MARLLTLVLAFLLLAVASTQAEKLWREDGKCGKNNALADGRPGQCDPEGDGPRKGPCCSNKGFCGNTPKHCGCKGCIDFSKVTAKGGNKPQKQVKEAPAAQAPPKPKTSLGKQKSTKPDVSHQQSKDTCGVNPETGDKRQAGDSWAAE